MNIICDTVGRYSAGAVAPGDGTGSEPVFIWRSTGVKAIADALAIWADYETRRRDGSVPPSAAGAHPRNGAAGGSHADGAPASDRMLRVVTSNEKGVR